jgi:general secretion pathway protein D
MIQRFVTAATRGLKVSLVLLLVGCAAATHHREGIGAMERGEYARGVLELQRASELRPGDIEYKRDWLRSKETATDRLLTAGANAMAAGDRQLADENFRGVLHFDRDNARAHAGIERIEAFGRADKDVSAGAEALKAGDRFKAQELVARALKGAPGHIAALALKKEIDAIHARELMLEPTLGDLYKKPINLEFRDASIKMVFDALSRSTGINFIFDRDVRTDQRTTVFLKQTSIDDAIGLILSTGQLEKKVLNSSTVLVYPNTSAKLREYQDLIVRAFYLANVEAKQAAAMLKTVLKVKDVFVDDKYNMLILREAPDTIALAEKLVRLHDLAEAEVMLEVEVLEINRSRLLNAGVQWSSQLTVAPFGAVSTGTTANGSTQSMKLSDLRNLNSDKIGISVPSATINLQKVDGDANLLANPRIRVRDREKAKIMIGDKVPVVTTTSTNTFVTENIQYLDVGLKLEVEPNIHLHDEVGLKLNLEVSSLVSAVKTNNGSQAYQIGTRNFTTALRLRDGETQVLAGLISDADRVSANRVPLVGELPILGRLFASQSDSNQKTEIVLSITPRLIRNIQREDASLESFWSGTEATLRNRPLHMRDPVPQESATPQKEGSSAPVSTRSPKAAAPLATGPLRFNWEASEKAKVGETVQLNLRINSLEALKAVSLQLGYRPDELEIVDVEDGTYFSKDGKSSFGRTVDPVSGRISISFNGSDMAAAKGEGTLLILKARVKKEVPETAVSVIALTPIGSRVAVSRPPLPVSHVLRVSK